MSLGAWPPKHPSGITVRWIDFAARLGTGETLTGTPTATVTLLEGDASPALAAPLVQILGTKVKVKLTGGADGARYEVFLQASTSDSLTVEDCAEIAVGAC